MDENIRSLNPKTYKMKLGLRIATVVVTFIFVPVTLFLGIMPFVFGKTNETIMTITCMVIGFGFSAFLIYGALYLLTYRLIIDDKWMTILYLNKKQTIHFSEILGFRHIHHGIGLLIYVSGTKKIVRINPDTEKFDEIFNWLNKRFSDYDIMELQKDTDELLIGKESEIEKQATIEWLEIARRFAYSLNIIGLIIGVWLFAFPVYYQALVLVNVILPLVAYLSVLFSNGFITFEPIINSNRPSVNMAFLIPSTALSFGLYNDLDTIYGLKVCVGIAIIAVILSSILLWKSKENKEFRISILFLPIVIAFYLYGATLHLNFMLNGLNF